MNKICPKHLSSYWLNTSETLNYPALQHNIQADVAVVGGGIAGITTAYMLAEEGVDVALLEARNLMNGTTGNTTAKLTAQHALIYDELIQRYGTEDAKLYYQANMEAIGLIKAFTEKNKIDCDLQEQTAFVYTQSAKHREKIENEVKAYQKLGIDGELVNDLRLPFNIETAVAMYKQAQFHPVKYLNGLLTALENMGVRIYENTMVTDVDEADDAGHTICFTGQGKQITCEHAVFATHYPTYEVDKFFPKNLEPESSYAIAVKAENKFPDGMYISIDHPKRTMRPIYQNGEQYVLVGGDSHTTGDGSSTEQRYNDIVQFAGNNFKTVDIKNCWSSHDLISSDRLPFIGKIQENRNIYVLTGFSKWGLTDATIGAKILADAIMGKENPYESLFSLQRTIHSLEEQEETSAGTQEFKKSSTVQSPNNLKNGHGGVMKIDDQSTGAYRDENGNLHLLDLSCTHMGCSVAWNDGDKTWDCPCHGSRFNATGEVVEGPALKALKKLSNK